MKQLLCFLLAAVCLGYGQTQIDLSKQKGVVPVINGGTGSAGSKSVSVSPNVLAFGSVQTGHSSPPRNVTLSNTGSTPLTVSSVTLSGTGAAHFSTSSICVGTLQAGASCVEQAQYNPLTAISEVATLTVVTDAPLDPNIPLTVSLSGTGTNVVSYPLSANCGGSLGSGTIVSNEVPPLINATCTNGNLSGTTSNNYASGATPTLTFTATGSSTLGTVTGCTVVSSACTPTISSAITIGVPFNPPTPNFVLNLAGSGAGTATMTSNKSDLVTGQQLNCVTANGATSSGGGAGCSGSFPQGTVVRVTIAPTASSRFLNWSGISGCTTALSCDITMDATTTLTANVALNTAPISLTQTCTNAVVSSMTIACTWPQAILAGDFITLAVDIPDAVTTVSSVIGPTGVSWTQVPTISPKVGTGLTQAIYYAQATPAVVAGGVTTVTLSSSSGAVSGTSLTSGNLSVGGPSYSTASITPSNNNLVLAAFSAALSSGNGPGPISTVTGNSLTWVKVTAVDYGQTQGTAKARRLEVWRALGTPSTGAITVTYATSPNVSWTVSQFSGVPTTGSNGADAIGITATNFNPSSDSGNSPATVTMGTFGSASNGIYVAVGGSLGTTFSAGANLTLLARQAISPGNLDEWAVGNVSPVQAIYSGTELWGIVGIEIKAAATGRRDVRAGEYSGILAAGNPVDVSAAAVGSSATAAPGSITPGTNNDLITNFTLSNQSVQTAATGFTQRVKNSFGDTMEDVEGAGTGAYNPSDALSASGNWVSSQVAWKPSGAPSSGNFSVSLTGDSGTGNGTITSNTGTPTLNCALAAGVISSPNICSSSVIANSSIQFSAQPQPGSVFAGWQGITGCGPSATCLIPNITANANIVALFNLTAGTAYYVSPTGSDSNSGLCAVVGTPAGCTGPWLTINHADAALTLGGSGGCVTPTSWEVAKGVPTNGIGACVHVANGTYSSAITTNKVGSASARIRYICDTQYGCKLNESSSGTMWTFNGAYTDMVGFDFDGSGHAGVTTGLTAFTQDFLAQANRFHDTASGCFTSQNAVVATFFDVQPGHGNHYIGNLFYHNNCGVGHINGVGSAQSALGMDAYDVAQNNIIIDHGSGYAVQVSHGCANCEGFAHYSTHVTFTNNTVCNVDQGVVLGYVDNVSDFDTISNNIVCNVAGGARESIRIHTTGCGSHEVFANNLMYGSTGYLFDTGCPNTSTGTQSGSNSTTFVNYTGTVSGDYHSKAGSTAINNGTTQCALTGCAPLIDFDGIPRPVGPQIDIGAYEQ